MKKFIIFILIFTLCFGLQAETWTNLTKNAQFGARESSQIVIEYNNKLYLVGGHNNDFHNDIYSSDDGQIWIQNQADTTNANRWTKRRSHGVIAYNGYIYVIAGYTSSGILGRDVWRWDGISESWTLINGACSFGRMAGQGITVFNNKIYMTGGWCSNVESTSFWDSSSVYSSTDGNTWNLETNNPGWSGRRNHACIVFDDKIWIIGGLQGTSSIHLCTDAWYSSDGINWTQATANTTVFMRARMGVSVYDGKLYIIGGLIQDDVLQWNNADSPESNVSNEVYYTNDGINWNQLLDIPWGKRASLSSIIFQNKLLIIAGSQSYLNRWFNDVWEYE